MNQAAYEVILGFVPCIVIASMIGYLVGEFSNSVVLSIMKVKMNGQALWMRTIGSTIVGEGVDTLIFVTIAFAGLLAWSEFWHVVISGYVLKVAYEVVATPVTYKIVRYLKKNRGRRCVRSRYKLQSVCTYLIKKPPPQRRGFRVNSIFLSVPFPSAADLHCRETLSSLVQRRT